MHLKTLQLTQYMQCIKRYVKSLVTSYLQIAVSKLKLLAVTCLSAKHYLDNVGQSKK